MSAHLAPHAHDAHGLICHGFCLRVVREGQDLDHLTDLAHEALCGRVLAGGGD